VTPEVKWAVVVLAFVPLLLGCGAATSHPKTQASYSEPRWQDVFEETPEVLVVVHPRAVRQDKVYGPLLRRVIDLARERSRVVSATRAMEAMEDADEVVVGIRPDRNAGDDAVEIVMVVEGVPASVDPSKLVDADGRALWAPGPSGGVRELVRERDERGAPLDASLFELPGRTWVIASGRARARSRDVFAHPFGRPALQLDPDALAIVRIDGPSLVARFRALQNLGALAALGRKLQSLTVRLPAVQGGVQGEGAAVELSLGYEDEDAAAFAEVRAREVVDAVARKKPDRLAWLARAKVDRPGRRVLLTLPLPAQLVDGLLHAGSATLDVDSAPGGL
jgi:hypothetical protein